MRHLHFGILMEKIIEIENISFTYSSVDEKGTKAVKALSNIEKIIGEGSGLGLIDVLAVYIALWSIDIGALVGLLDDRAYGRMLENNPELKLPNGTSRLGVVESLTQLQTQVHRVLAFADSTLEKLSRKRLRTKTGNIR